MTAGTYDLRATGLSRITATVASQSIAANASLIVNITLPKMGTIAGVVRDPNHNPIANAQVTVAGSSLPHNNMMPYLCVLFIIAMQGVFPPRT